MVNNTHCPALHDCEFEGGEAGQQPEGDEVLKNTKGLSLILPERPERTERANLRLKCLI